MSLSTRGRSISIVAFSVVLVVVAFLVVSGDSQPRRSTKAPDVQRDTVSPPSTRATIDAPDVSPEHAIRGYVRNLEDAPVPGAIVTAHARAHGSTATALEASARTQTDQDGSFVLGPLDDDYFSVVARHKNHGAAIARNLRPSRDIVLWLRPTSKLSGTVRSKADRTPVAGASVHVLRNGLQWVGETDHAGQYELDVQAPLETIVVVADGFRSGRRSLRGVQVRSGPIDFFLMPGSSLVGEVRDASTGLPISGALVSEGPESYHRRTRTDTKGEYVLEGVSLAAHRTHSASAPGYHAQERQTDGSGRLSFALERGLAIHGRIMDPDDRPVAGASVFLHRISEARDLLFLGQDRARRMTADAKGHFKFFNVVPGAVAVIAFAPGFGPGESRALVVDHDKPPADDVVVHLVRSGTVEASVRDAHGKPLAGATVRAVGSNGGGDRRAPRYFARAHGLFVTNERGLTRVDGLIPGSYTLSASHREGGVVYLRDVAARAGETTFAQLEFVGHEVSGRVFDIDGVPVSGAQVSAWGAAGTIPHHTTSDGLGRFRIAALPSGSFRVGASIGTGGSIWTSVTVPTPAIELRLLQPELLRGIVETPDGEMPDGFSVSVLTKRSNGRTSAHAVERMDHGTNRFEIPVRPGNYDIVVRAPSYRPAVLKDILVRRDQAPEELRFRLLPGAKVTGVALGRDHMPLPWAWVFAVPKDAELHRHARPGVLKTTHEGRFELTGLAPGVYEFRLDAGEKGSSKTTVNVPVGETTVDLWLGSSGTVAVTVTDGSKPVAGAYVTFHYAASGIRAGQPIVTNAEGIATSHALPTTELSVRAEHRDHGRAETKVVVSAGRESAARLALE